ncbi:MAG TPA: carboxypeptidase-like regulatory domain-containing protein [Thermoanaerobaculia bacterium]|nr:carboxypeptidase-like regulatory domain-containing protein [Thermoanaerobaculia bacterium]
MRIKALPSLLVLLALLIPALAPAADAAPIPVSGLVLGPGGSPLAGARVLLIPTLSLSDSARLELEGKAHPDAAVTAVTGADGAFRLEAPEGGMWEIAVEAKGMVLQEMLLHPLLEEAELPPVRLEGDAKLEVRVAGPDGKPLAGARVQAEMTGSPGLRRTELRPWRTSNRAALTDAKGVAVLPRGARERLLVRAGVEGQPFSEQKDVGSGSVTLRLVAGTAREIRVMDAAGKSPVPGVWVRVGESRWLAGRTGADGRFSIPVMARSKLKVVLTAEDGRSLDAYAEPPKTEEKDPRVLLLPALETMAGRVVSAADGRPIAGALVWNHEPKEAQRTGADGAYRINMVAGRDAWPQAAAAGYLPADAHLGASPGVRRGPTLALEPALAAAGVVVDEQGRPVPGVLVQASPHPATRVRNSALISSGGISRTTASGRFRTAGLLAGVGYELRLSKAGFAVAREEIPPLEPGRRGLGGTDLRIVLRRGRTGFGRVVDQSDRPVVGARVELRPALAGDRRMSMMRLRQAEAAKYEAAADATGRFEVRDLPAGTWELTARGSGFAPLTVPGLKVPEGGGATDLGTVVLVPGVGIEGFAVDPEGRPIPGAEIRLIEANADPMSRFLQQEEPLSVATSAQDGFFRIEDRRAGETVDLTASRSGYAPGAAAGVQVPPDQPVRLVLQPSSAVEGRTVDPDGKPVAGAQLFIHPSDPMGVGGGIRMFSASHGRQAVSDETGFFRMEDVVPGGFELQASATGYQRSELANLEVRSGQELKGLEVVLAPGAVIEGRVFSPSGQPLAGAEVGVTDPTVDFFFGTANTDGDGRFRLEGIAPGTRSVQAEHKSYRRAIKELEVRLGENSVDLRLEGGVEIRGRVVDEGGIPVASARVSLRAGPRSWNQPDAASAADGSFTLDGVADGTYRVIADKQGFARSREGVEVTVAGSSLSGIEVKLSAGGAIVGQLSGLDFAELSQVQISLGGSRQAGQVSPDGSYRIDHVEPGEHRVTAALSGGSRQAEGRVILELGAPEARLDLEFSGGLTLTGRVLRNGAAASGLSVMLSGGGLSSRHGDTDHQGRFRFEGIDAGSYELQVYGFRSGSRHREAVELSADRDVLIELNTVAVSGRVVDAADQAPIPNAQVILMAAQPDDTAPWQNTETTADSRGVFRLRDVAEGSWKVRAVQAGYGPAEVDVQVDSGRPVDGLELSLEATEGIVLEVLLPSGRPPDMVHTAVFDAADRVVSRGSYPAGEDGRVRVASVAPGAWDLFLDADGSATVVVPVTAPGNGGRVILPQAGGLNLKVPGLAEARVEAKVTLADASGKLYRVPWGGQVMKNFDLQRGSRRFEKLSPGQWTLNVSATDGRTWTGTATVLPGGTAEVTLE